ncbi:MAG: efflux RND transporter permease subunit [Candidatus Sericytochromatia bacterium]
MSHPPSPEETESKGGFNISEVAIKRPVTTTMLILVMLVMGMLSYQRLPVELFPDVSFPIVSITTMYPGASAQEMETLVAKPIEDGLSAINGIEHITSTSSSGIATVILQFVLEKNIKDAANEVQEKMALVRPTLPEDVEEPLIARVDPNAVPVQFYTLTGTAPLSELTEFARDDLKPRLQKVDGVAEVNLLGGQEREVQVMLNPSLLSQYKLSSAQVVSRLQQENLDFPSGQIETNQSRIILRTVNSFKTAEQIGNTPIQIQGGKVLLLKDLGTIRDGFKDTNTFSSWNGKPSVVLSIQKQSGTNTVEMAHRLEEEVHAIQENIPPGIDIELAFDTAKFVEESKDASIEELLIGSLLAIVVIFAFLRTVRGTIIAAIAIPTSVISTYTFMAMMGFSLNFMSLMALSLVVGILVDDAVVDLENIFRHIEMGETPFRAAINATNEIGLAVVATTFSIVAVFAPVGFMGGIIGRFFRQFGLTVSVAVLVSLLVARTLTPMLSAYFLKPMPIKHEDEHEAAAKGIGGIYQDMLRWALKRRAVTIVLAIVVFVAAIPIAGLLPTGFAPSNDQDEFSIAVEMPSGSSLAQTRGVLEEISRRIKADPLVESLLLTAGSSRGNTDSGSLAVTLVSKKEGRKESSFAVQARMQKDLKTIPGTIISFREAGGVDDGSGANAAMNLSLQGDNLAELQAVANRVVEEVRKIPIVTDVKTSTGTPRQEINLRVDHRRAMELGVSSAAIAGTIRAASLGDMATQMRLDTNNVDVRVRLDDSDRYNIDRLQSLPVMTASGNEVPLGALASIAYETGPTNINRYDRERQVMVYANNTPGSPLSEILNPVTELLKNMDLPEGVTYEFQGEAERMKDSFGLMGGAMLLAVMFIYMILASQFESFFHPFTIMMAVPLSFAGAFLGLFLANKELGLMSMIGIIMLMGLVVKNSILLVDYTITLRKRGVDRNQALLMAGPVRLRPILMTTIAMVAGMIPVAMQLTVGSETRSPMAVAVIGGLITSTLLTLLVVPVAYTIVDDMVSWVARKLGGGGGGGESPRESVSRKLQERQEELQEQAAVVPRGGLAPLPPLEEA